MSSSVLEHSIIGNIGFIPSSSSHSRSKDVLSSFPLVDLVLVIKSQLLSVFAVKTVASEESLLLGKPSYRDFICLKQDSKLSSHPDF